MYLPANYWRVLYRYKSQFPASNILAKSSIFRRVTNSDGFILRCFAILLISLSVKSGPVVAQQLAHFKQSVHSNTCECKGWIILSRTLGFILFKRLKNCIYTHWMSVYILQALAHDFPYCCTTTTPYTIYYDIGHYRN